MVAWVAVRLSYPRGAAAIAPTLSSSAALMATICFGTFSGYDRAVCLSCFSVACAPSAPITRCYGWTATAMTLTVRCSSWPSQSVIRMVRCTNGFIHGLAATYPLTWVAAVTLWSALVVRSVQSASYSCGSLDSVCSTHSPHADRHIQSVAGL